MNREEIKTILPHRDAMLLVDEVVISEDGEAEGRYTIRGDEWFLQGHFPDNPVVPGVMLCEMMAQACCVLLSRHATDNATPYFTKLDKVRFRRPVKPGDVLVSRCHITREKAPFFFAEGTGHVGDTLAVSAEFSFALMPNQT